MTHFYAFDSKMKTFQVQRLRLSRLINQVNYLMVYGSNETLVITNLLRGVSNHPLNFVQCCSVVFGSMFRGKLLIFNPQTSRQMFGGNNAQIVMFYGVWEEVNYLAP